MTRSPRTIRRTSQLRLGPLVVVGAMLAACGGGASPTASSGGAGQSAPLASAGSGASSGPAAGGSAAVGAGAGSSAAAGGSSAAGGITDLCKVFTDAEITTFLGRPAHGAGPRAATTPNNCTWQDDNLTTVWLLKADPDTCASDQAAIGSASGSYPGVDFAGPSPLGATFAGVVSAGTCYEIEVGPTERSPKPDAVAALLAQFVQRAGA